MPVILPPGFAQVGVRIESTSFRSGYGLVTFGVDQSATPLQEVPAQVLNALNEANVQGMLSEIATIRQITAINSVDGVEQATNLQGLTTADMPPGNVAMLWKKKTNRRGRRAQGRMFWPFSLPESAVLSSGEISGISLAVYQDIATDFLAALDANQVPMVLLQGEEGNTPPITPPPFVTQLVVDGLAATQRRRMRA